jgi:hypothetical protein
LLFCDHCESDDGVQSVPGLNSDLSCCNYLYIMVVDRHVPISIRSKSSQQIGTMRLVWVNFVYIIELNCALAKNVVKQVLYAIEERKSCICTHRPQIIKIYVCYDHGKFCKCFNLVLKVGSKTTLQKRVPKWFPVQSASSSEHKSVDFFLQILSQQYPKTMLSTIPSHHRPCPQYVPLHVLLIHPLGLHLLQNRLCIVHLKI